MTSTQAPPEGTRTVLLSQIVGVEKSAKQKANRELGDLQKQLRRTEPMNGISRTYRPRDDADTELMPREEVRVQVRVNEILNRIAERFTDLWNIVYTREAGNNLAKADIVVGERVIATDVPATFLIFLGKQLDDLLAILHSVPVQDPSENWTWDPGTNTFRSDVRETVRSKKKPFPFVKAQATDKHPAQVEVVTEDVVVGYWDRVLFTSALQADRIFVLVRRAESLQRAVKFALEKANSTAVPQQKVGEDVFAYLFAE